MYYNSFNLPDEELNIIYFKGDETQNLKNFSLLLKKCLLIYNTLFNDVTIEIDVNIRFPYIYDLLIMFNSPTGKYVLKEKKDLYYSVMNKFNELSEYPLNLLDETNKDRANYLIDEIAPLYSSLIISV
jgi:hypothetical protein